MEIFTDCFEALFKICSDPDPSVQSAATFLDRLIKVGGPVPPCYWPSLLPLCVVQLLIDGQDRSKGRGSLLAGEALAEAARAAAVMAV